MQDNVGSIVYMQHSSEKTICNCLLNTQKCFQFSSKVENLNQLQ